MREVMFVFLVAAILAGLGLWAGQTGFNAQALYALAAALMALQVLGLIRTRKLRLQEALANA